MLRISFVTALLLSWHALPAADLSGRVVHVADGDSLTLQVDGRLVSVDVPGVDAPELHQSHGLRARKALAAFVFRRRVLLSDRPRPPAGEPSLRLTVGGADVGRALAAGGHAWVHPQLRGGGGELMRLEAQARRARRGLWASDLRVAPWHWRRGHGSP